jgi:hypothetical protein
MPTRRGTIHGFLNLHRCFFRSLREKENLNGMSGKGIYCGILRWDSVKRVIMTLSGHTPKPG